VYVIFLTKGTIEVSIATMKKSARNHVDEVYVIGFVPTYELPAQTLISLDPFLDPLILEIENGFIEGIDVEYALALPGFPSGPATLHHLLLLWTGDHMAQCEVSKALFVAKKDVNFVTSQERECLILHAIAILIVAKQPGCQMQLGNLVTL
jgi:hypothetical protein